MIRTAILIALVITTATAAHADGTAPTKHVKYRDLNLSTPAGIAKLDRRIQSAANEVCAPAAEVPGSVIPDTVKFRSCRKTALAGVRPQMLAAIQRASGLAGVDKPITIASG